ncbi:UDP-N-acetylglucosamine 4,6-dehydratase [Shewanella sp. D64]|uniref:UDP-N-acetylglucosamine 4,6-dehydratase n=1 Tax=unclassified Shewanella TaxID=196818 RepID=UPI0022BA2CB2|nr:MULTISPECIES: UDP-N-acetylglucosamine 4,6-dehydratase [unclassified Shewanella]MEC4726558.1 UDP-N-acetylglucosamine 4,6-dehydratase [Shewanella sp. D64]MEC4737401.1 UDP-N-acetylglucosamine 4,6-dehydratase [Shewanella sp. E94]WBJ97220.1 UDP-N-acetylglucosamine 4,6-dehydratase [Shewanella sp. MTB7]
MTNTLTLIGRDKALFSSDIGQHETQLINEVSQSRFLVLGGAGSIGQAVVKEIFKRVPLKLHVVDISENNLAELVRDVRSSFGYIKGGFQTFTLDIDSVEYDAFINQDGQYDYVLNLSALKHVRSEKDPFTLMRMINVNIFNTDKTIEQSIACGVRKYFCVSTDKAANPVNMMGASKRIMEMFLMRRSQEITISTARFANVAFSDGSLLHSFNQRMLKHQPIVAPTDIKRYFVTAQESGELCLMSCIFGENRDIFFPKLDPSLHLISFADIAIRYLKSRGYEAYICRSEAEARQLAAILPAKGLWPCYFTVSDTTGEKDIEEFFTEQETLDMAKFSELGIIKNKLEYDPKLIELFEQEVQSMKSKKSWSKEQLVQLFHLMLPEFGHKETGRSLDDKM